jgi:hypothetical protein
MFLFSFYNKLFSIYWPYKVLQRQEKDRQQHQANNLLKQPKLTSYPSLPSLNTDNGDTCERATSPLRMLTPAKRLSANTNHILAPVETAVTERAPSRNATPVAVIRQDQNQLTGLFKKYFVLFLIKIIFFYKDRSITSNKRPSSKMATPLTPNGNHDRSSRRGYRVTTSLNIAIDDDTKPISPTFRGKTPLI